MAQRSSQRTSSWSRQQRLRSATRFRYPHTPSSGLSSGAYPGRRSRRSRAAAPAARNALTGWQRWMEAPSQITSNLPRTPGAPGLAQEADDGLPAKRRVLDVGEHPAVGRYTTDDREMVAGEGREGPAFVHAEQRCGPRTGAGRSRLHPPTPPSVPRRPPFFSSSTRRSSRQMAIAASSRCVARRMGFCTLQSRVRSRRLTCAGW